MKIANKTSCARIAIVIGLIGLLASCGTLVKSTYSNGTTVESGVSYFLPKRYLHVSFVRTKVAPNTKCAAAKTEAVAAKAKSEKDAAELKGLLAQRPQIESAIKKAKETAAFSAVRAQNTAAVQAKLCAAPDAEVTQGGAQNKKFKDSIKITELPYVPDPNFHFVAELNHIVTRDDSLKLVTTASGLLSNADAVGSDRISDIVVGLAEIAGGIKGLGTPRAATIKALHDPSFPEDQKDEPEICEPTKEERFEVTFDPTSRKSKNQSNTALNDINDVLKAVCYSIEISPLLPSGDDASQDSCLVAGPKCGDSAIAKIAQEKHRRKIKLATPTSHYGAGLFYRRPLPYVLTVRKVLTRQTKPAEPPTKTKSTVEAPGQVIARRLISIPNESPISILPFDANVFAKTTYDVKFKDGMLISQDANRPSEILSAVKLPLDIVGAFFGSISEIFQLKINLNTQESGLIDSETALLEALDRLEEQSLDSAAADTSVGEE